MAVYSATVPFAVSNVVNTPMADLLSPSNASPRLFELGVQTGSANALTVGCGISAVASVPLIPVSLIPEDPSNTIPCFTDIGIAWSQAPSTPTAFVRRLHMSGASIGQSMVVTWPRGFGWGSGKSFAIIATSAIANLGSIWMVVHE